MEYTDVERQILANQKDNKALMLQVLKQLDTFGVSMKYGFKPVYSEKVVNKKIADTQKIASIYREGHTGVMGKDTVSQIVTSENLIRELKQQFIGKSVKTSQNRGVTYYFHKPESVIKYVVDVLDMYEKVWEIMGLDGGYHYEYNKFIRFEHNENLDRIFMNMGKVVYYSQNKGYGECEDDMMYVDFLGRYQDIRVTNYGTRDYKLTKEDIKYIQGISDEESDELDRQAEAGAPKFIHTQEESFYATDFSQ